jgi:hypothetical protein
MRFIRIGDFEVEDPLEIAQSLERFMNALGWKGMLVKAWNKKEIKIKRTKVKSLSRNSQ